MNEIKIPIITPEQRVTMAKKSALSLPNKPSQAGWTPEQFKMYITKPLFDDNDSFYYHINKISIATQEQLNSISIIQNDLLENKVDKIEGIAIDLKTTGLIINENSVVVDPTNELNAVNKRYVDNEVKKIKEKSKQIKTTNDIPSNDSWSIGDYAFVVKK